MLLSEILELERNNTHRIYLHLEGMFWKAYQCSAYLFLLHYKNYKVTKKFVKSIRQEVVSLGFPSTAFDNLFSSPDSVLRISEKDIYVQCTATDEEAYVNWFRSISLELPIVKMQNSIQDNIPSETIYSNITKEDVVITHLRDIHTAPHIGISCLYAESIVSSS